MSGLSKSRILYHRQCPKRLWLQVNRPDLNQPDASAQARMDAGNVVGDIARGLFPGGVLIDTPDLAQAIDDTRTCLAGPPRPLYEATFETEGVLVRADLLIPDQTGYRMIEVKSATSVKDYYYADAAIQTWVAQRAVLPLTRVEIAHIDTRFVYPGDGDYHGLLNHVDVTEHLGDLIDAVPCWINEARATLDGDEPVVTPGAQCSDPYMCPFMAHCSPPVEGFPPEILPNNRGLAAELRAEGYTDLRDVPEERLRSDTHRRIWRATRAGTPELNPLAGEKLSALPYPRYYLDFETINPAVPAWAGTRPYMQVPFQWSFHIEHADGRLEHHAFLAENGDDPRRPFIESMLDVLGSDGPIFVYNIGFERSRMNELMEVFPDRASEIALAIDRLVDLLPIAKAYYYHPEMRGSWSIKAVLPTIDADLAYDNLPVGDGGMAQAAYLEMTDPQTDEHRKKALYDALLTYCQRDTLGMVAVAHFFQGV